MSLFLRTCKKDFTSHSGFKWPETVGTIVTAPDWSTEKCCGKGLHGLLEGRFDSSMLDWSNDAVWMVVESDLETAIDLDGKHKFESCEIKFIGDRLGATKYLLDLNLIGIHGSTLTGGDGSTLTGGDGSTLTGGNRSTLTGGDGSTLTGGNRSTLTGGNGSTLTGGNRSTLTGGDGSTLTGGYGSTLTGGDGSTLTCGYGSTLILKWWDSVKSRLRISTGYTEEGGLKANTKYKLDDFGNFVEVK